MDLSGRKISTTTSTPLAAVQSPTEILTTFPWLHQIRSTRKMCASLTTLVFVRFAGLILFAHERLPHPALRQLYYRQPYRVVIFRRTLREFSKVVTTWTVVEIQFVRGSRESLKRKRLATLS